MKTNVNMSPNSAREKSKRFLSKNKSVRLYKEKRKKRDAYALQRQELVAQYTEIDASKIERFDQFPLTNETKKGLKKSNYITPTEIQRETIGLALKSHDILGAAKTGSGKTVAFVVPILERLYCEGWCKSDGLGVLVITPTRELAMQIYGVCKEVGSFHDFTIGLVIGGKDLREERKILNLYNIVICTPGRLLQHMDENPLFDAMNLQMLVLDEADRILDLGFQKEVNAILENLPTQRQTLLFSATQTKSIKDLARLSLKNPMYVSVHEHAKHATPEALEQSFLVCELHRKLDFLWSFIKNHKKQKILVFMASCKQVKHTFEAFCRMKPGVSLTALYGGLHQMRRIERYQEFCRKIHVVMFATDLAARGLDFPNVNWVVQLDCPEDVNTYIHRAGRTARYEKGGESLLILLPSEKESMIKQLKDRKIPINEIKVHPSKLMSIQRKMQAQCARDINLGESARRAFKSYYKNVFLMKDKTVFDIAKLDTPEVREAYASSLGLEWAPRIRFIEKRLKAKDDNRNSEENCAVGDRLSKIRNDENKFSINSNDEDSDEDLFLLPKLKQAPVISAFTQEEVQSSGEELEEKSTSKHQKPLTKAAVAKKILKKKIKPNTKLVFDDDGETVKDIPNRLKGERSDQLIKQIAEEGFDLEKAKLILAQEDAVDKVLYREKIKQKHKEKRMKLKEERRQEKKKDNVELAENQDDEKYSSSSDVDPNNISLSESEEENDNLEDDSMKHNVLKRKNGEKTSQSLKKHKTRNANNAELMNSGSLEDDESLALHFLTNS